MLKRFAFADRGLGWPEALFRSVLGPPACLLCEQPADGALALCNPCRQQLPWLGNCCRLCALPMPVSFDRIDLLCGSCLTHPPLLDGCVIPLLYARPADRLLLRFKNGGDLMAGRVLAELLQLEVLAQTPPGDHAPTIVPIPLHDRRLRRRGFNQALELARPLARRTGWKLRPNLLRRTRQTPPFQGLPAAERTRHARGLFAAGDGPCPQSVLLIDDILTTGATIRSATATLRRAGCRNLVAAAVARTDLRA